jgi:lysophospholipase L1-like esterase
MNKNHAMLPFVLSAIVMMLSFLLCSEPAKPPEKPRLAPVTDMSVFADDTLRLSVDPLLAPATISGYIWSFAGNKTYSDTTKSNAVLQSWSAADAGIWTVAVKVLDSRGVVSDSVPFKITVFTCKPALSIRADTIVDFNDPCSLAVINSSDCNHIRALLWSFDGGLTFSETSPTGIKVKRWNLSDTGKTVTVVAKAEVASGLFSDPASLKIRIDYCRSVIDLSGDSVSYLGETTRWSIAIASRCSIAQYLWSFNNGVFFTDTTLGPSFLKKWQPPDTGVRIIIAAAQTSAGIISALDSARILVSVGKFRVMLPHDTVWPANDTLFIISQILTTSFTPSQYIWSIDGSPQGIMTENNILSYCWPPLQAGTHRITVRAVDAQGRVAQSDTMTVTVVAVKPFLSVPHDTLVRALDTVIAMVIASVEQGTIVRYLWNVGSLSWTDSSASPWKKIWRQGKDTVGIAVGARDDHGNLGIDSFHVFFNAPPTHLQMLSPRDNDTLYVRSIDSTFARNIVTFRFSASDRNGLSDSLTFLLSLGKATAPLQVVYQGRDSAWSSPRLDTGRYYWKLKVQDKLGDSSVIGGSFTSVLQQTICFAGHSIIVGVGGSIDSGGIRAKVLSTLRSRRGGDARVKSIGPLPTGFLKDKKDDSCLAVSSYKARDLLLLMRNNFPTLTADMWVVMLGVNESYRQGELQNLVTILDLIHGNNPLAYTYVINGLPYPNFYGQDTVFNKWLADSIRVKKTLNPNRKIWTIDAYKLFSVNNAPNPNLFSPADNPLLHPNQKGYDSLAQIILDTMNRYR